MALLTTLAPHLKRALNTHRLLSALRSRNEEMRRSVETLGQGLISLDSRGQVIRMSRAAQAILDARDGIKLEGRVLRAGSAREQIRLTELWQAPWRPAQAGAPSPRICARHAGRPRRSKSLWTPSPGGAMLISRKAPKRPLQLVAAPFHSDEVLLGDRPAALVFLGPDPDARPAPKASLARSLYGLTPTESRLADLLAQGWSLTAAAERLSMASTTARFHLQGNLPQDWNGRQAELVRLMAGLPGGWAQDAQGL